MRPEHIEGQEPASRRSKSHAAVREATIKLVRFRYEGEARYGCVEGDSVYLLPNGPFGELRPGARVAVLQEVELLAPCEPSKVVAVGLNYRSHAQELSLQLPPAPLLFIKPSTSVVGPEASIVYPAMSERVDYEAELAVVIGQRACGLAPEEAAGHILGYTCGNDVTARDLQSRDGQWTRSKGFDSFCPLGPWIVTDLPQPNNTNLFCRLNGVQRQAGNTSDLIFDVSTLVSFVSQVMTLQPGDVLLTGTPSGIGPMNRGDTVEIEVEGIGVLRNRLV
jgi:2-keto-4-pentenoate hydratase/2-oxohepta-3-ene-1,7-dioic acid hydratase in catechol pathway